MLLTAPGRQVLCKIHPSRHASRGITQSRRQRSRGCSEPAARATPEVRAPRTPGLIKDAEMRRSAAVPLGLAMLVVSGPALSAGEPGAPISLAWVGMPGCPDESDLRAEIERVLGGPPDPASRRYLRAEARVS